MASKQRVCYHYDRSCFVNILDQVHALLHLPLTRSNLPEMRVLRPHSRRWQLPLRPGSPDEAAPHADGALAHRGLRPVPQDGGPRTSHVRTRVCWAKDVAHASQPLVGRSYVQRSPRANILDMTKFHSDDYINFLRRIKPNNTAEFAKQLQRCTCSKRNERSWYSLLTR